MNNILKLASVGLTAVGTIGMIGSQFIYTVDGGQRAVMFNSLRGGVQNKVIGEGSHFYIPIISEPKIFDVRMLARNIPTRTGTKDLQKVNISLRILFQPKLEKLPDILKSQGHADYADRIIPSLGNDVMKSVVAKYNAEELITKRSMVSKAIETELRRRAEEYHLVFRDISITHLTFSPEFTLAVEAKQVAYQESERSKWVVKKEEQIKKAKIIRADGEEQSAKLISNAVGKYGSALVELRKLEAAKDIATALANSKNITYLPENGNMLLKIDADAKRHF
mmetsp:Transcript_10783/g.15790  ORF Transcript_10783/g.15790 Transcript_10783/m.15790 type:complete len:280 (-) Transcript_10783:44-883(-)